MNDKDRYYGCRMFVCRPCEKQKTFEDLQKEIEKLNNDINALKEMDLDIATMYTAIEELKAKKADVRKQMHEMIDKQYA